MENRTETDQPRKRWRLATLVTLGVCATLAMSTTLQLLLVDHYAINYANKEAELRLQQLSWQTRDALNRVVQKATGDVQLLSDLPQVRDARSPAEVRAVLESVQKAFPDYAWIGLAAPDAGSNELGKSAEIVCAADSFGDQAKGQTAMENCLQKNPDVNVVYTINEPAAAGAYQALKAAGKEKDVLIVSVDGGCAGVKNVKAGMIAATSQQYPLKMASRGVAAGGAFAKDGKKASGYTDTGVTLITDKPQKGVDSKDTKVGMDLCWGNK